MISKSAVEYSNKTHQIKEFILLHLNRREQILKKEMIQMVMDSFPNTSKKFVENIMRDMINDERIRSIPDLMDMRRVILCENVN